MKAIVIEKHGDADVFKLTDVPKPLTKPGHVLIKVEATSVNPVDTKIRKSGYNISPDFPAILHGDVAGIIAEIGDGVRNFKPGDEIYGCAGGVKGGNGALAEYMLVDADLIALKPKDLSFGEAAALPLVSITAWEALVDKVQLQPGQKILVHAGAGGVGHIAIQLAKHLGAEIYTTISGAEKEKIVRQLGANEAINYRQESVEEYVNKYTSVEGFDVIMDTVGGENLEKSFAAAKIGGKVITILASGNHDLTMMHRKMLTLYTVMMLYPLLSGKNRKHHGFIMNRVTELVEAGEIKPLIDKNKFAISQVGEAHKYLESGKAMGKIVLRQDL